MSSGNSSYNSIYLFYVVKNETDRNNREYAFYYYNDHLGSAAYLTDDGGQVTQTLNYLPYGEDWVDIQNNLDPRLGQYTFNGKEKDWESGFHYYGARYYWSEVLTGWLSVDPMTDKYPNTSPYVYCSWNPILFVDPDGKEKLIYYNTNTPKQSSFKGVGANIRFQNAMSTWKSNCSLKSSANRYKDSDGVIHLFAHGSSQKVDLAEKGTKDALGLDVFLTNTSKTYKENIIKGETSLLIMHACSTGKGENSIAQQLSKNTKGDLLIFAPSDDDLLGKNEKVDNSGVWNVFYKGELLGTYNGNTDFSKEIAEKGAQNIINFWKKKHEDNHVNE